MYNKIRKLINEWDPVNLINQGAPNNEYDYEINQLITYLNNQITVQDFAMKINTIFRTSFGDDIFNKNYSECLIIAEKCLEQQRKTGNTGNGS